MAGFSAMALAWRGTASSLLVPTQLPFLVSGGIGGAALLVAAVALLMTHLERRHEAADRVELDTMVRVTAALADAIRARRRRGTI